MFTLYFGLKQMSTRHNGSLGFLHRKQETSDLWTHTHTMEKKTIWSRYVHFLFFLSHNVNREVNTEPSSKSLLFWSTPCVHRECDIWTWLSHNNRVQLSWVSQSFRIYKKTFQPLYAVDIPLYCKSWYWNTDKHTEKYNK